MRLTVSQRLYDRLSILKAQGYGVSENDVAVFVLTHELFKTTTTGPYFAGQLLNAPLPKPQLPTKREDDEF